MGRKTFESLGRVLPNRKHIVLSKDTDFKVQDENVQVINDISLLGEYISSEEENFVIGGASIYKLLMPYTSKMYITKINQEFEGDVFFPEIEEKDWGVVETQKGLTDEKNVYDYEYVTYVRK